MGQRKNSEFPWGIEPQTFGFCTAMLYHWARETLWWERPITKFIHDTHCAHCRQWISGSAMSIVWALLTLESLWLSGRALYWSVQSKGLRFNYFSLSHTCDKTKNVFLYFFIKFKTYHLSYCMNKEYFPFWCELFTHYPYILWWNLCTTKPLIPN